MQPMVFLKNLISNLLQNFGYSISRSSDLLIRFQERTDIDVYLKLLSNMPKVEFEKLSPFVTHAKSQLGQELFVLHQTQYKNDGYFVEFGATNGFKLSNTYLLEKEFKWTGILAEPAHVWHKELRANRSAHIESKCVWSISNMKILFNETSYPEISTLEEFSDHDMHSEFRKGGKRYKVDTISLNDMLEKYGAPSNIDYLSIDTEGSELEILESLNFEKYKFSVITVEHNFTKNRQLICDLLSKNGYERVLENMSLFDDWYVFV
jgi:FkbM family methyltransferase